MIKRFGRILSVLFADDSASKTPVSEKKTVLDLAVNQLGRAVAQSTDLLDGVVEGLHILVRLKHLVPDIQKDTRGPSQKSQRIQELLKALGLEVEDGTDEKKIREKFYIVIIGTISHANVKMAVGLARVPKAVSYWKNNSARFTNSGIDDYGIVALKASEFRQLLTRIRTIAVEIQTLLRT